MKVTQNFKKHLSELWALLRGLLILLLLWQGGEWLVGLIGLPFPGSVLGMVLMWLMLRTGLIPIGLVHATANLLTRHMSLFFIPLGVGLLAYWEVISQHLAAIVLAAFVGSLVVFWVTGIVFNRSKTS